MKIQIKLHIPRALRMVLLLAVVTVCSPFVSPETFSASAQNRISGHVFGLHRQPMGDLRVELMDDYHRAVGRTKTTGSGRYEFAGMGRGTFTVRVYTFGTDYEEAERSVEIQNVTGGSTFEQLDFNLRLRKGITPETATGVIYAQEVPADAKKLYEQAVKDLDGKRTSEGIAELKQAIEIFPTYYAALEKLGMEYIKLGKPETYHAAEILFAAAVEVHPRGFKSWHGLAYSRFLQGKFPEAMTAVTKALELNGNSPDALFLSGVLMKKTKRYDEAEKQLIKARDLSKNSLPSVYRELADVYAKTNRYGEAAKALKQYLKANPEITDAENIKKLIVEFETKAQEAVTKK